MEIQFHPFHPSDSEALIRMVVDFYEEGNDGSTPTFMTPEKVQKTITRAMTHPGSLEIWLFKDGELLVGYCLLCSYWSNEYSGMVRLIDELYVVPSHRNQGISTRFIRESGDPNHAALLTLEVFHENKRAFELYQRLGFEVIDRVFMKKVL